ncbi:MAG: TMAO reductase system periplasmic protein TorT [Rhizobiaceae bacterium]|nr:TMAO reductase system periplasmic protein TorT [Rhizobiaceae bacterium]
MRILLILLTALLHLTAANAASLEGVQTWAVDSWQPPFDYSGRPNPIEYTPLARASRPWRICAAYPHIKDSYWLSVNYGMVEHAKRLGIGLTVVEAGGYPNLSRQVAQIQECSRSADALIVGAVSYDGLTPAVRDIARRIPVIAAVNDINSEGITAKSGVSWTSMGDAIGTYFMKRHPRGQPPVKVAWFPGPKGAGWVSFIEAGLLPRLADSSAEVVATKWGDTGFEAQLLLIEEVLEEHPDIDYIIGSAVTADAAVSLLRAKGLSREIRVLADYFTHGTYRAIKRGKVMAAPTDSPVLQGKIAIDQAVRAIEGSLSVVHAGPSIKIVDQADIAKLNVTDSLAPAWFRPTFQVR